jgi:hypothetical protein
MKIKKNTFFALVLELLFPSIENWQVRSFLKKFFFENLPSCVPYFSKLWLNSVKRLLWQVSWLSYDSTRTANVGGECDWQQHHGSKYSRYVHVIHNLKKDYKNYGAGAMSWKDDVVVKKICFGLIINYQ